VRSKKRKHKRSDEKKRMHTKVWMMYMGGSNYTDPSPRSGCSSHFLTIHMADQTFEPTEEEKVEIDAIQEGEKRSEKIHKMTEEIEDKHREGAEEEMHEKLDEEPVL